MMKRGVHHILQELSFKSHQPHLPPPPPYKKMNVPLVGSSLCLNFDKFPDATPLSKVK